MIGGRSGSVHLIEGAADVDVVFAGAGCAVGIGGGGIADAGRSSIGSGVAGENGVAGDGSDAGIEEDGSAFGLAVVNNPFALACRILAERVIG